MRHYNIASSNMAHKKVNISLTNKQMVKYWYLNSAVANSPFHNDILASARFKLT